MESNSCVIRDKLLTEGFPVTVRRGMNTLFKFSALRKDNKFVDKSLHGKRILKC